MVGQSAAEASPATVMDMSFANQALATECLVKRRNELQPQVYVVPSEIDDKVARLKLDALGVQIDSSSPAQLAYASTRREGT